MSGEDAIRPGLSIDCAVNIDEDHNRIDVRRATIYDTYDTTIIISQTSPSLVRSCVGRRIALTFISREDYSRKGVSAKIDHFIESYQLSKSQKVEAIFLTEVSELKGYNLRFAYRVRPPADCEVTLYSSHKDKLKVIDVSALGVKFEHSTKHTYEVNQQLKLYLGFQKEFFELNARVVRKDGGVGVQLQEFEHIAVQFIDLDYHIEEALRKMVRTIERKIAAKRMFE